MLITCDALGNLTKRQGQLLIYNTPHRPHAPSAIGSTTLGYDANGNLISKTLTSTVTISYTYDAENWLINDVVPIEAVLYEIPLGHCAGKTLTNISFFRESGAAHTGSESIWPDDISVSGGFGDIITKRYHADGHQLVLCLDNTLYRTPLDPTGVGLMVNSQSSMVNHQFSMVDYSYVINHWLLIVDYCQFFYGTLTCASAGIMPPHL